MNDLITKLGIDWKLLVFQIINFFILLWVLKRYAYKPILGALERRQQMIAKGVEDAKKAEEGLSRLEQEKERVLREARKEEQSIVEAARKDAVEYTVQSREVAKAETAVMLEAARREAVRTKETIVREAKTELADLVVAAAEKVIRAKLDPATDRRLLEDALDERLKGKREP